jgi:hypothetical protein
MARVWARLEQRVRDYVLKTTPRRRVSRVAGLLLFACMTVTLMGTGQCASCRDSLSLIVGDDTADYIVDAIENNLDAFGINVRGIAHPHFMGTDGSQTGVASFLGNFTSITQPSGSYFTMVRTSDCSLSLITAASALNGSASATAAIPHYERTLHQLASLTTTSGVYPNGCPEKFTGYSTRLGAFVGRTSQGVLVYAVVSSANTNAVYVLTANSTLTTVNFNPLPGLAYAAGINTGDFNGDGNGDLVVVNGFGTGTPNISVALGNADGSFQTPVTYSVGGSQYTVAAVVDDVNNDGKLDIVTVSNDQTISVLLGNGDGTFQPAMSFAAPTLPGYTSNAYTPILGLITADTRGIGKKDIICSNGSVLLGNGNGTFTAVATPAFPYTSASPGGFGPGMATGDINNDGKIDLVVDTGPTIFTYLGNGNGTFTAGTSYAAINNSGYVTLSDLDGDGNLDIYTGLADGGMYSGDDTQNATAYVLMGNGNGTFVGAPQIAGTYNGTNLGDVNGDGIPDIIAGYSVELGSGHGTFTPTSTITIPTSFSVGGTTHNNASLSSPVTAAVGDVNGDGKADYVFVDSNYPTFYFVAISNGNGTFQTAVPYAFPQIAPAADFDNSLTVSGLRIADFRNNGKNDLIYGYNEIAGTSFGQPTVIPYNQGFAVLLNTGGGTFSATPVLTSTYSSNTAPSTAFVPQILSTTDLNGDSKADLIVTAPGTSIVNFQLQTLFQIYVGNGDGTFQAPTTLSTADQYGLPVVADFNKDGKLDLAWLAETSNAQAELVVALGNGNGTFGTPAVTNLTGGDAIRSAALAGADFNGDGDPDLALLDVNDFSGVFYGKGDGTFTSVPGSGYVVPKDLINIAAGGTAVAVKLTTDGRTDILAGSTVLLNLYGVAPVIPATSTLGLTASASTIAAGGSVKFTATITPATGSTAGPTGTVTFYNGTTAIGTGTVASNVATLTTTGLTTVGSDSIYAVYGGDTNFSGSPSAAVSLTVTGTAASTPTVTVTPGAPSITTAQALMVTVAVSGGSGNPTPTGSVTLSSTGYTSATTALVSGSAPITVPAGSLAIGLDTLMANYTPDANSSSTYNSASGTHTVTVTAAQVTVPNVVGLTQAAATSAITAAGLTLGTVTTVSSATVAAGSVISQNPPAGNSAASGSAVNLVVSTGPAQVTVPNVVGLTQAAATSAITAAGLTLGTVTTASSATVAAGSVISQSPLAGSSAASGSPVSLVVSTGAAAPTVMLMPGAASLSFAPGATTGNSTTITVTPSGGFTGSVTLTAAVTQSPTGATDLPVPSFGATSPVSITGVGSASGTLTVATTAPGSGALAVPKRPGSRGYETGGAALAGLLLLVIPGRRRGLRAVLGPRTLLGLLVCLAALGGGLTGCGGGGNSGGMVSSNPGTTAGNYTITVTATAGTVMGQTTVAVTVN